MRSETCRTNIVLNKTYSLKDFVYLVGLHIYMYLCNLQVNEGKLPEDDTFCVETCGSLIIYIFIIIVLLLVDLQKIKNKNNR